MKIFYEKVMLNQLINIYMFFILGCNKSYYTHIFKTKKCKEGLITMTY